MIMGILFFLNDDLRDIRINIMIFFIFWEVVMR